MARVCVYVCVCVCVCVCARARVVTKLRVYIHASGSEALLRPISKLNVSMLTVTLITS